MKAILAATAALLLSTATVVAADSKMQPGQPSTGDAGKSTNSDGSAGANPSSDGTVINQSKNTGSNPDSAGKSTNSDGSSGASGASSGEGGSSDGEGGSPASDTQGAK
ncbi:hypothetical protein [uncultured Hyphomicrobium sp.]|uniref:hypothetical protein n=1 Tax=uncultured Hyphomicrobium sp. TaxID=194373 RepID=UPI0025F1BE7C|nr:hypothetical protein [uncultured Hyphomicrobium sp.]